MEIFWANIDFNLGIIHLVRTLNIPKTKIYLLIGTRTYQGVRNVNFSEYFAYVATGSCFMPYVYK